MPDKKRNATERDKQFMRRALELAALGRGLTRPNPMVGAVLVKRGRIVGEGYHRRAGGRHAEIAALAGKQARGATLYVTLEPCAHQGRTAPCVESLIAAGIAEVRYSIVDPNPLVNGAGARCLRAAGIRVSRGLLAKEAERLNEIYLHRYSGSRPFVILKTAQTLDGRIACSNGDSQWISGIQSRRMAHRLRAEVDAVVVGSGTANQDDPLLTVRLVKGANPYRIALTSSGRLKPNLRLLRDNDDQRTIIATSARELPKSLCKGLILWSIKSSPDGVSLTDFLDKAWGFGIHSLVVEGGARLATAFLRAGLVDKHIVSVAPRTLGAGIEAITDLGARRVDDAIGYDRALFSPLGADIIFSGYPQNRVT